MLQMAHCLSYSTGGLGLAFLCKILLSCDYMDSADLRVWWAGESNSHTVELFLSPRDVGRALYLQIAFQSSDEEMT